MTVRTKKLLPTELLRNRKTEWYYYGAVFAIWVVWNLLTFHNETSGVSQIKISPTGLTLIRISVIVPYLLTWELATHALLRLRSYANALGDTHEAKGFYFFFRGIAILLAGMITVAILPTIRGILRSNDHPIEVITIIINYAYVVPYLLAFWSFYLGARELNYRIHQKTPSKTYILPGILLTTFAYLWLDLIFTNPLRSNSTTSGMPATYYLRDSLIILTIVIPSFIAWILGYLGVLHLKNYGQRVKGVIYRSALGSFVKGVSGVIIGSILLQGVLSLGTTRLLQLGLTKLLLIVYIFLIIQALGFFFIALGSYRLTKIESV